LTLRRHDRAGERKTKALFTRGTQQLEALSASGRSSHFVDTPHLHRIVPAST